MSVYEEPEWWQSIDRKAALAELHPPLETVRKERPGGFEDRVMRRLHEAGKARRAHARAFPVSPDERDAEADRLIAWFEKRRARREGRTA